MEEFTTLSRLTELCNLKAGEKIELENVDIDVVLIKYKKNSLVGERKIKKIILSEGKKGVSTLKLSCVWTNNVSTLGETYNDNLIEWYRNNETNINWWILDTNSLTKLQNYIISRINK